MREKWGLHKKPYISWLGRYHKVRVRTNAMRLDERKCMQKVDDTDQLRIILPKPELDMPLVLVLVQDSSSELNFGAGSSQNRLAPPTPNSK